MKKLFNFFIIIILFGLNYKKKILQSHVYLKKNCDFENRINDLKELIENYLSQKKVLVLLLIMRGLLLSIFSKDLLILTILTKN